MTPDPQRSDRARAAIIAAAIFLITLVTFFPVIRCGFVNYDDPQYVTENAHVRGGLTLQNVAWTFAHGDAANYHPLTFVSLMLDRTLWGESPVGFHATNLLLHSLNAALVLLVLRALTRATWQSAIVAAIFAVHPLRVESVAWITERKDVLSGFFGLLAIGAYVRFARSPGVGGLTIVGSLMTLSLLAKPTFVTLPALLLLLDVWPLRRVAITKADRLVESDYPRRPMRAVLCEKLPLLSLSLVSAMMTFAAQHAGMAVGSLDRYPIADRVGNALVAYGRYLCKIFWPTNLAVFYPHQSVTAWASVAALVGLIALTGLAIYCWRHTPSLSIGWFWFVGTLIPMIGLVQVGAQSIADRYTYIPMIGVLIAVAWALPRRWFELPAGRFALATAVAAIVLVLSVTTRAQIAHWNDSATLFEHALAVTDDNHVAHVNLAVEFAKRGDLDAARRHYLEALRISPTYSVAHNGYGALLARLGDAKGATQQYELAVAANPDYALAHRNLARQLATAGRSEQAIAHFRRCLQLQPFDPRAHNWLGIELARKGQLGDAVLHFDRAFQIDPSYTEARLNLARALVDINHAPEAMRHLMEIIHQHPEMPQAHYQAGVALARMGKLDAAADQLREAIKLDPRDPEAQNALEQVQAAGRRSAAAPVE